MGCVAPGAGAGSVLGTPENGAGAVASAESNARPRRVGTDFAATAGAAL